MSSSIDHQQDDARLHYARLYSELLGTRETHPPKGSIANNSHMSGVSISLPTKLFRTPHSLAIRQPGKNERDGPVWPWLLTQYNREGGKMECLRRVAISDATWCSHHGGAFASEIDLTELWRLFAAGRSFYFISSASEKKSELENGLVKVQIVGELENKPLIRLTKVPYLAKLSSAIRGPQIPSTELAEGICGVQGLEPSILCLDKSPIFSSIESGWQYVRMPNALAFTLIAYQHRDYLGSYIADARQKAFAMSQVCWYLWDHADSIDCDDNDVPIKLTYETFKGSLKGEITQGFRLDDSSTGLANSLLFLACEVIDGMRQLDAPAVEIEDAFNLLEQSVLYRAADRKFSDANGTNTIVEQWWAYFGQEKARWVALLMTTALCMNLSGCSVIPIEFEELLRHPSGKCYII